MHHIKHMSHVYIVLNILTGHVLIPIFKSIKVNGEDFTITVLCDTLKVRAHQKKQ